MTCRILGHRPRFWNEGSTMRWACARCGEGGAKTYTDAREAERYARAFDREDREDLGRRAPLIGLLPLRLVRALRSRWRGQSSNDGASAAGPTGPAS